MDIRKWSFLAAVCLLASLMPIAHAKDKDKGKPTREQAGRNVGVPSAGRIEPNQNRGGNAAKETPRVRIESAPRIDRRNESIPSANSRSQPQSNLGSGLPKRDDASRDNRGSETVGSNKQSSGTRASQFQRPEKGEVDSAPARLPNMKDERRDRTPIDNGALPPSGSLSGQSSLRNLNPQDINKPRLDQRDGSKVRLDVSKPGDNKNPKAIGESNSGVTLPTRPTPDSADDNKTHDHRNDGKGHTVRGNDGSQKSGVAKSDPGRLRLNPGDDVRAGVVKDKVSLPNTGKTTVVGHNENRRRATPIHIEKNGHVPKIDSKPEVLSLKPEVGNKVIALRQTRDHKEFERRLSELRALPDAKSNPELVRLKLDRVSGVFQQRVERQDFRHWHESDAGRRLNLDRQFQLHRHGDLSRQMNLGPALVQAGGWQHRYHGTVIPTFTRSSFSVWYAGGGYYPRYCWTPRWNSWVDWCWWDTCLPIYDPRPVYCRPIVYTPCPTWAIYDYPVWQPLPVVACGTWVDVPIVNINSGMDLQLLATRFVDNGHPDQNLGPRYRVWLRNNGPLSTTTPFNVMLIAANDPVPQADLPQAGAIVNGIEAGQIQSVDIRLPLAANRLAVTPEGQRIPFSYLHVLVDSHRELAESDESNNGSVIARNVILPVDPAAFSSDVSAGMPGSVIKVAGEGLGPEPGQIIVSINGLQLQAEIHGWYDLGVRFALPNIAIAGPTDADILIVRGDGAAANPLDFELVPQTMLGDSPLPPIPSP